MKETIDGILRFHVSGQIAVSDMATWEPERIEQFFRGLSIAQAAIKGRGSDQSREVVQCWEKLGEEPKLSS